MTPTLRKWVLGDSTMKELTIGFNLSISTAGYWWTIFSYQDAEVREG